MDGASDSRDQLRILILQMYPYPGVSPSANHMQRLARGLRELGHDVLIIAPRGSDDGFPLRSRDPFDIPYVSFELPRKPRWIPNYLHLIRSVRGGLYRTLSQELQSATWHAAILTGESWWVFDPARKLLQKHDVAALPYPVEWFAPSFAGLAGLSWFDQWMQRRFTHRNADGLIGISSIWSELASSYGKPSVVIPAFNKYAHGELPPVMEEVHSRFRIVFVGRWVRRELPCTIFRAMERALDRGIDLEFVVLGSAGKGNAPSQRIEERSAFACLERLPRVRERIRMMGWLDEKDFEREIASGDAFVLLRDQTRETRALFPTRLPEYLATGKPLIVSDAGDLAVYLEHMHSAYVIPPGDQPEALAEAFCYLATHPREARAVGQGGREAAGEVFSQSKLAQRIADFVRGLASSRSPR